MSTKVIQHINLTDTLTMSELKNGFWLYDKTRGMNLSVRAKTEREAFTEAIKYYQKRCAELEARNKKMNDSIDNFIESLSDDDIIEFD